MVQEFLKRAEKIDISKTSKHKESLLLLIDQLQEYLDGAPFKWSGFLKINLAFIC